MPYYSRKLPRLAHFDYSSPNYYYVTICTDGHRCLFGHPAALSPWGNLAYSELSSLSSHYENVRVDKFVVMPNHIHAIFIFDQPENTGKRPSLPAVVGQYKSAVTKRIRQFSPGIVLWQKSYYEEVIRNESHYLSVWNYIDGNPSKWEEDELNHTRFH